MEQKVKQEFYCRHCPADEPGSADPLKRRTGGHFRVVLPVGYDANLKVRCPKCGHEHDRHVINGQIFDGNSHKCSTTDNLRVGLSAWTRMPVSDTAIEATKRDVGGYHQELRAGVVPKSDEEADRWRSRSDEFLRQSWMNREDS